MIASSKAANDGFSMLNFAKALPSRINMKSRSNSNKPEVVAVDQVQAGKGKYM